MTAAGAERQRPRALIESAGVAMLMNGMKGARTSDVPSCHCCLRTIRTSTS
jgi:hypothetical protein